MVLAPESYAARLTRALEREGSTVGLTVQQQAEVAGASFTFNAESFNPAEAATLQRELLGELPDGVELRDVTVDEKHDESCRGAELYSPAHHFSWRVSAEAGGPLTGLLEMHRRASSQENVRVEPVRLILG